MQAVMRKKAAAAASGERAAERIVVHPHTRRGQASGSNGDVTQAISSGWGCCCGGRRAREGSCDDDARV
jgi:hypothetical protein